MIGRVLYGVVSGSEKADPGGPVRMVEEFYKAFSISIVEGIKLLMLLSVYLGLFNLLPIPALDGGHLMFLAAEAVLRRPLPLRVREVAHIVGMTIVISLMAVAFKNDLEKRWDVLLGQVREISG